MSYSLGWLWFVYSLCDIPLISSSSLGWWLVVNHYKLFNGSGGSLFKSYELFTGMVVVCLHIMSY